MNLKGHKVQLELNNKQKTLAFKHAGTARHAYNWGVKLCKELSEKREKLPSAIDLHKKLVADVKSENKWYYEVSKCAPQEALRDLMNKGWSNYFRDLKNGTIEKKKNNYIASQKRKNQPINYTKLNDIGKPKFHKKGINDNKYVEVRRGKEFPGSDTFTAYMSLNYLNNLVAMNLTNEQIDILNSDEDIKINAVAGSGKTTTLIEYARTRPSGSKILYLVFNRSVKLEAIKKFSDKGLSNVTVETAHSLAYRAIVVNYRYKIRANGYKINEIAEVLDLASELQGQEKITQYIIANHINKFIALFCNSDKRKVQELNYLDVVSDLKAKNFVKFYYSFIENKTRQFLSKMDRGEIEIIHDFYLKKFQLSNPVLPYDYILFDEGQDASPAMLDVFIKQNSKKVIVGDTHQQIYGWRYAVNSLEKSDFKSFNLSISFRFNQDIANLAVSALDLKTIINDGYETVSITGKGTNESKETKAIIARTNLGLLVRAIKYLKSRKVKNIYFEGNINSYTYADEGASLYDVLNLYNEKHHLIRDVMIKSMKDLEELEEYIESTEDVQLGMMLDIVNEYGNEIPAIIKQIKDKNCEKEHAEIIFSTVHRCKGMEYDSIELADDFITEKKLKNIIESQKDDKNEKHQRSTIALNEEINLLYVAITRTKNIINIPEELVPRWLPHSNQIKIITKPIVVDTSSKLRERIYGKDSDLI